MGIWEKLCQAVLASDNLHPSPLLWIFSLCAFLYSNSFKNYSCFLGGLFLTSMLVFQVNISLVQPAIWDAQWTSLFWATLKIWPLCNLSYEISPSRTCRHFVQATHTNDGWAELSACSLYLVNSNTRQWWKSHLNAKKCETQSRHGVKIVWLHTLCPTSSQDTWEKHRNTTFPVLFIFMSQTVW